jgi:hypothetical protein
MTKKVDVQGHNANKNGKGLEAQVEKEIAKYGIRSLKYSEINTKKGRALIASAKRGFLLKNVPYTNMFGSRAFGEFVLCIFGMQPTRIECRAQHVAGSVQDKLPKLLEDCKCMQEPRALIVLEGTGVSQNAREWVKNAAEAVQHKEIKVQNFAEFSAWLRKELVQSYTVAAMSSVTSVMKNILNKEVAPTAAPYIITKEE